MVMERKRATRNLGPNDRLFGKGKEEGCVNSGFLNKNRMEDLLSS